MDCHQGRSGSSCSARSTMGLASLALVSVTLGSLAGYSTVVRSQQPAVIAPLVFDGVTVIDVQWGRRLPAQRVVIVGNRIQAVGNARGVQVPAGARVVDARGKYLIPGLWDMHTHLVRPADSDLFHPLFIANGVTGIRDAWSVTYIDTLLLWRREILAGTRVGPPRQLISGVALDEAGNKPCRRKQGTGHLCVTDPADARHVVDSLKAVGADMIKTYELERTMYFAIAAEARRVGIPFGGHLNPGVATAIEASDSGARILDHVNTAGDLNGICWATKAKMGRASVAQCRPVAERFRRNNTWWVPTLVSHWVDHDVKIGLGGPATHGIISRFNALGHTFWSEAVLTRDWLRDTASVASHARPSRPGTSADSEANMNVDGGFLRIVQQVQLPILAGTDVHSYPDEREKEPPGGFALHMELALMVAMGLTPLEALQAATLNPAKFLHATDSLGTVASGKLADLVLLDADPLADITNTTMISAVVANGRYFDRTALDKLVADAQAKANGD